MGMCSAGCGELGTIGNVSNLLHAQRSAVAAIGPGTPLVITEFGAACTQGIGDRELGDGFTNGGWYHDVADQAAFVVAAAATLDECKGCYQSLSYWAFSDVFEENFWPVHNVSFHGMFVRTIPFLSLCIQNSTWSTVM
jgi:hypothetical protein